MREIKFRAWDGGEWRIFSLEMILSEHGSWLEDHYDKWCEFTGLRDKNGKEIYEGDIVQDLDGERYEAQYFSYAWMTAFRLWHTTKSWSYGGDGKDIEVIGNIYEGTHDSQSKD